MDNRSVVCCAPSCRQLRHTGLSLMQRSAYAKYALTVGSCDACRELAEESGIHHWGRVPALNTNATFIDDLADAVLEALPYVGSMAATDSSDGLVPLGAQWLRLSSTEWGMGGKA